MIERDAGVKGNCDLYTLTDILASLYFGQITLKDITDTGEREGLRQLVGRLADRLGLPSDRPTPHDVILARRAALQVIELSMHSYRGLPAVLFAVAGTGGVGFYRCKLPSMILKENGVMSQWTASLSLEKMEPFGVVVLQRQRSPQILRMCEEARKAGKKFVYEIDDDLHAIPEHSGAKKFYIEEHLKQVEEVIAFCDMVTVSTKALAQKYGALNPNVRIIPNKIPLSLWPSVRHRENDDIEKIRVLVSGSPTHEKDISGIAEVLSRLAENPRFQLVFWGQKPHVLKETDYEWHPFGAFEHYPTKMVDLEPDIALLPLEDSEFNRSKSNLKWLEYSAAQIPVVASDVETYSDIWDGKTGFLRKNEDALGWMDAINFLADGGAQFRTGVATRAYEVVRNRFNIESGGISDWEAAYKALFY